MSETLRHSMIETSASIDVLKFHDHEKPWVIDYCPPQTQPGQQYTLIADFDTLEEAEAFIGIIEMFDPEHVHAGYYGICGPSEDGD